MIFTMPHRNFREALQFVTLHAYRLHPDLPPQFDRTPRNA